MHGWMNLSLVSSSAAHLGDFVDDRRWRQTWNWVPQGPGTGGVVYFATAQDGWVVSPPGDVLYVTHDGAKSWQNDFA